METYMEFLAMVMLTVLTLVGVIAIAALGVAFWRTIIDRD